MQEDLDFIRQPSQRLSVLPEQDHSALSITSLADHLDLHVSLDDFHLEIKLSIYPVALDFVPTNRAISAKGKRRYRFSFLKSINQLAERRVTHSLSYTSPAAPLAKARARARLNQNASRLFYRMGSSIRYRKTSLPISITSIPLRHRLS